jgi:hypothetical protein
MGEKKSQMRDMRGVREEKLTRPKAIIKEGKSNCN